MIRDAQSAKRNAFAAFAVWLAKSARAAMLWVVPYQSFEERMDRLEGVLTTFVQHTDETIVELRQDVAEMRQWRVQAQKQWGDIANKLGTFVEDIVSPNIPRISRQLPGMDGQQQQFLAAARLRVWHP